MHFALYYLSGVMPLCMWHNMCICVIHMIAWYPNEASYVPETEEHNAYENTNSSTPTSTTGLWSMVPHFDEWRLFTAIGCLSSDET